MNELFIVREELILKLNRIEHISIYHENYL